MDFCFRLYVCGFKFFHVFNNGYNNTITIMTIIKALVTALDIMSNTRLSLNTCDKHKQVGSQSSVLPSSAQTA